jgi:hypothetical protein
VISKKKQDSMNIQEEEIVLKMAEKSNCNGTDWMNFLGTECKRRLLN